MLQPRSISPIGSSSPALLQRLGLGQGPTTTAPTPSPNQDNNRPPGLLDDYMVEQVAAYSKAMGELASSHPEAYASFVRAQDEAAAALAAAHSETSTGRVIIPEPGFVVRASITPAGPRISEAKAGAESARSQPLLVNIVSHHAVQRPVVSSPSLSSSSGTAVLVEEEQGWTADLGIQVPLLIGARRSTTASDTTVDVLVNPWVVREALKHRPLQAQVVNLALEWVAEETGLDVRADEPCVVLPAAVCSYWDNSEQQWGGGGGAGKPRPFILDEAVALQQLAPEERPEQALQDPQRLLVAIKRWSSSETPPATATATATLLKPRPHPSAMMARRVPISIEEDSDEGLPLALKRGFLLD